MIDLSKKYETRDGEYEAIHIENCPENPESEQLMVLLEHKDHSRVIHYPYFKNGNISEVEHYLDLVPARETVRCRVYRHVGSGKLNLCGSAFALSSDWELIGQKEIDVTDLVNGGCE